MDFNIDEIEKDILKEIVNIGLAKAGDSFAAISKDKILLKVPAFQFLETEKLIEILADYNDAYLVVNSDVKGDLNGKALILYTEDHVKKLCEACLDPNSLLSEAMKISLLLEVSNIITGALLTQLANILHLDIHGSPPSHISHDFSTAIQNMVVDLPQFKPFIFLINTQFINSGKSMELPMLLIFDKSTLHKLLEIIRNKIPQAKELAGAEKQNKITS